MGRIWRSLKLGMKSLLLHKLRSGLTVLGIVFGVAAVIAMLAVGEGSAREAQERFRLLGATNIIYRSVKPSDEAQASSSGRRQILNYGLKYEDFDRLIATIPTIRRALPIREIRKQIRHRNRSLDGRVVGTTHDYMDFNHLELARGRFLSEADNAKYQNYAVLAAETAETLFPYEDPIGDTVKIGSDYYTVIGVMQHRASSAGTGGSLAAQDFNRDVYIPLNTCRLRFGDRIIDNRSGSFSAEEIQLSQITLQVGDVSEVEPTADIVEATVTRYHPKKDVELTVPYELLLEAQRTARQFSIILGTIASISLLVGGIGIMNIMLATVTERTREIGIRRALGAKRRDITEQFLIETVVLSGVGGLLGIGIGVIIPQVIVYFVPQTKVYVTPFSVLLAFSISVGIGILFGLYPARRAALMDPIEALRHE
ncbi:MAG: ABC transporter permease [Isosphaeraceae bacterium]|nr:ABC transporter permease [Isosphaeraceae bacterium]